MAGDHDQVQDSSRGHEGALTCSRSGKSQCMTPAATPTCLGNSVEGRRRFLGNRSVIGLDTEVPSRAPDRRVAEQQLHRQFCQYGFLQAPQNKLYLCASGSLDAGLQLISSPSAVT